jgi:hypothetical protein
MVLTSKQLQIGVVVTVIVLLLVGYFSFKVGSSSGYANAEADIVEAQEEAATRAAEEVAKAANPFDVNNPLKDVEANPFEKTKKILNPFSEGP